MTDKLSPTPAMLRAAVTGEVDMSDATPAGILAGEKRGQTALVESELMPVELVPDKEAFEALGFAFIRPMDNVFWHARLPAGWTRAANEHSMWSEIRDETGRVRVRVFYKATFYDRKAHASLVEEQPGL